MTGAGSAQVAWGIETAFDDGPSSLVVWRKPGEDLEIGEASLDNALSRKREPDQALPIGSREGNLEGALTISWDLTDQDYHEMIFPDDDGSGNENTRLAGDTLLAPSATWYLSSELPTQTEERWLTGAAVTDWSFQYNQGEMVRIELTIVYADEPDELYKSSETDTSSTITPANQQVSVKTSSVDHEDAEVVLYDGSGNELDRVPANSTEYQNTTTVNGTDIAAVRLVRSGSAVTGETITVNDDVDGTGTDTDTSVDTENVLTVSNIETPSKSEIVAWHDVDWEIDGVGVDKLQSLSLSLSNMARMQRGQSRKALEAVIGAYEPSLSAEAILEDGRQRSLAYGSATADEPLDSITETDTTITIGSLNDLDVLGVQPTTYDWASLVAADEDITEPTDYHVREIQVTQN